MDLRLEMAVRATAGGFTVSPHLPVLLTVLSQETGLPRAEEFTVLITRPRSSPVVPSQETRLASKSAAGVLGFTAAAFLLPPSPTVPSQATVVLEESDAKMPHPPASPTVLSKRTQLPSVAVGLNASTRPPPSPTLSSQDTL